MMNEAMKTAWLEISQMLGEPTREELDVFLRTWQRAMQARSAPVQDRSMLECSINPRPLSHSLHDYHTAMLEGPLHYTWTDKPHRLVYDLIAAVKFYADRAAPVQEPVAWMYEDMMGLVGVRVQKEKPIVARPVTPLYTTPPAAQRQWVGLTDEEVSQLIGGMPHGKMVRAIEAKLKEKNT
jgi:hypothetical protein